MTHIVEKHWFKQILGLHETSHNVEGIHAVTVENGLDEQSSNPEWNCQHLHITLIPLWKA